MYVSIQLSAYVCMDISVHTYTLNIHTNVQYVYAIPVYICVYVCVYAMAEEVLSEEGG